MQNKTPVKVFLEGKLGKLFGREWSLCISSPAEALHAININTKGKLREYLLNEGSKKYYKIALQKKDNIIDPLKEIKNPSGQSDIYFIPTIKGSSSGTAKIVAGAILIIIGIITIKFGGAYLITAGIGLMLGGAVQLLTPIPKIAQPSAEPDLRESQGFQGNAVNIFQGASVGIVYGRALVAPMPISASMENVDIGTWGARTFVPVDPNDLNDGNTQYPHTS